MELVRKKNDYFQNEIDYLTRFSGYTLVEQREDFASLHHARRNISLQIELANNVMDMYEHQFLTPCLAIKHSKEDMDYWYLYLLIDDCPVALDLRVSKVKEMYRFRFDASKWNENGMDLEQLPYLAEHIHTKAMNILAWFEDWLINTSPYRLWFVTGGTCHISYSEDARIVKSGPEGGI